MANVADTGYELGFELYEMLPDAMLAVDQRGVIRYANRQAGRLFGQDRAALVSAPVETLIPEHLRERHVAHRAKYDFRTVLRPMGTGLDLVARRADGTTFPVDIMLNPLKHLAEPMVLAVVRDMTELRAIEEQKQKALMHDRLQLALDAAQLGWWHYDPIGRVVSGDTRFKEIFEVAADETTIEEIDKRLHPDDVDSFRAEREAAVDPADPKPYAIEYRIRRRDGEVRWVEAHGLAYFEGSGPERRYVGGVGTVADITERKQREEVQARLAAIVTSSADAIIGKTLDGIVTTWNEAAEHLFGYSAGEMIGQSIRRLVPADRQAEEDLILARVARSESIVHFETVRLAKDGRTFDASVTISPVRDAGGRIIGAAKIIRDITARKRAEEQVRLLMREVNHRAKNMLSVVDAIARQTATREPEHFIECFSERIHALSANQDLLIRNEWRGVEIADLVRAQLAPFADLIGSRIVMSGPKLRLNAASAQAIGLALHELATNAGKYGALSDTGRVDTCWGSDGNTFTMSWTERDGPPVSPSPRRGFGTVVMKEMAERSVDGRVELDYAPSGVTWRLTCSAVNALEPTA